MAMVWVGMGGVTYAPCEVIKDPWVGRDIQNFIKMGSGQVSSAGD